MATTYMKFTTDFTDQEKRTVQIGPLEAASIDSGLKQKILDFNVPAIRNQNFPGFDNAFVSDYGGSFVRISKAQIITTNKIILS